MAVNFPTMQQFNINICCYKEESKGCSTQISRPFYAVKAAARSCEKQPQPSLWCEHGDAYVGNLTAIAFIKTHCSDAVPP